MLKFGKLLLPSVFILGAFVFMDRTERVWSPGVAAALLVLTWLWQRAHQQHRLAQADGLLYRETFEQTLVGIAHLTKDGRLLRANPAFVDLLGYPKGELMRKTFQELTHPDDLAKGVELAQQVWNKLIPNYTLEKRYIRKDGGIVWGLLSVTLPTSESGEGKYFIANVKDITARKKAEVALSESTLQLELATEAAQLGIWEYEIGTGKTYVRGRLWANMGFVSDSQSLVTLDFFERIHADDRELVRAHFHKALETRTRYSCEYRFLAMDGRTVWLEGTGHPWEDDQGNIIRVMGVIRIITDRKLAEIDFQRSVDVSPAILWITEQDGQCAFLSQRWYAFTGQTPDEALGFGWLNAVHEDDRTVARQAFVTANANRIGFYCEYRLRTAAGDYRWTLDAGNPRFNAEGQYLGYAGSIFDIHDKKIAQSRLEETAGQFNALANSMPQLVWTAHPDGKVDYYNDRASEYEGFCRCEDGNWNWQPCLHPDDLSVTIRCWHDAVRKVEVYSCEHRVRMQNGLYRWHLSRAIPVLQDDGTVKKWYGTATDIHEYKLALVELARAKESAEEASQAKSRFLANMSHEIRSPMSSVLGYADLLLERSLAETDRLAYAASIKTSGGHLLAVIDDILDLSAVESGEFKIERQAFAVVDLIAESVQSMSILAQKKGLELQVVFETPVPEFIDSDPLRFRQVLLNLMSNAIKFTDVGRIVIKLGCYQQIFRVEVEDTGSGIAASKTDRLFKAFSQVDAGISRKHGGTGLGLHLSRRLAQALNGDLRLYWSVPGCGSSFVLELPLGTPHAGRWLQSLQETPRLEAPTIPLIAASSQKFKVLLAEDSADNQMLIKIFLKKLGAYVEVACNGEEAVQMAMKSSYDIVLMDMMMPVLDGLEATRRLRSLGYKKPIVALTAHALKEEVDKTLAAGCDYHLSKPLQLDVLRHTLDVLLNERPADSSLHATSMH